MAATSEVPLRAGQPDDELSLTLENRIAALGPGQAALREFLERRGIVERRVYDAELVLEELFINTVRYGYADQATRHIEVTTRLAGDDIVMTFDDDARGFDPTAGATPVLPEAIEDLKIGGLGLLLVRKVARAMQYRRVRGRNNLRLCIPRV